MLEALLIPLGKSSLMPGDYTICTEMFGSGVLTGMEITQRLTLWIPRGSHQASVACIAAVAGQATHGTAVQRLGIIADRQTGMATSFFASRAP